MTSSASFRLPAVRNDCVCACVGHRVVQAREAGIDLQLESSASLSADGAVRLRADPYKISQVIRNLVSNALKFTSPSGSVRLSLAVEIGGGGGGGDGDVGDDADIEMGCPASISACFSRGLRHSRLRYSKTFAEVTYLVLRVQDSGVGISAVGYPFPVDLIA